MMFKKLFLLVGQFFIFTFTESLYIGSGLDKLYCDIS